jgi:hypothetical protein
MVVVATLASAAGARRACVGRTSTPGICLLLFACSDQSRVLYAVAVCSGWMCSSQPCLQSIFCFNRPFCVCTHTAGLTHATCSLSYQLPPTLPVFSRFLPVPRTHFPGTLLGISVFLLRVRYVLVPSLVNSSRLIATSRPQRFQDLLDVTVSLFDGFMPSRLFTALYDSQPKILRPAGSSEQRPFCPWHNTACAPCLCALLVPAGGRPRSGAAWAALTTHALGAPSSVSTSASRQPHLTAVQDLGLLSA